MDKLIKYLNGLTRTEQSDFARSCGTSVGYLRKAASVGQLPGPALCVRIEKELDGKVTRKDLRPDWEEYWPELLGST